MLRGWLATIHISSEKMHRLCTRRGNRLRNKGLGRNAGFPNQRSLLKSGMAGANRGEDALHPTQSPWENSYWESFNGKLRNECSNGEIFYSLKEAQIVIEKWRVQYKTLRPHSALGYRPPAPAAGNPYPPLSTVLQPWAVM